METNSTGELFHTHYQVFLNTMTLILKDSEYLT